MPEALIGMGNVHNQSGDYAAAVEALTAAINAAPDSPHAYFALADAYAQSGDVEQACASYESFLGLDAPEGWKEQARQAMSIAGCP